MSQENVGVLWPGEEEVPRGKWSVMPDASVRSGRAQEGVLDERTAGRLLVTSHWTALQNAEDGRTA